MFYRYRTFASLLTRTLKYLPDNKIDRDHGGSYNERTLYDNEFLTRTTDMRVSLTMSMTSTNAKLPSIFPTSATSNFAV